MEITGFVAAFAPALGPTFAGRINDVYSWRHVFYSILPIVVTIIIIARCFCNGIIIAIYRENL